MKFTAHRTDLTAALALASKVLAKRVMQPILGTVLFNLETFQDSTVKMTATDLDNTLVLDMPILQNINLGTVAASPKDILAGMKLFPKTSDIITIDYNHDSHVFTVSAVGSSFTVPALPAEDFPDLLQAKSDHLERLSESEVCTIVEKVAFAASQVDYNSILGGVCFKQFAGAGMEFTATDGSRLTTYAPVRPSSERAFEFILPVGALNLMGLFSKYTGGKKYNQMGLIVGKEEMNDKVTFVTLRGSLTCRTIAGQYPRYSELFPSHLGGYRTLDKAGLLAICNAVIAKKEDHSNAVTICGLEVGNTDGSIKADLTGTSSSRYPISLNANYLKQWILANDCTEVTIKTNDDKPLSLTLIQGHQGDIRHLLMPISVATKHNSKTGKYEPVEGWWTKSIEAAKR